MSELAFFSGGSAQRDARRWCDERPRPVLLDARDFAEKVGPSRFDATAAAAACAAAARALFAAGYDVAVCGEEYDLHWRHRLGPLMGDRPRARRRIEGSALILRAWEEDDVGWVHDVCQDPEVVRWTNIPWPYHRRDALALLELSERGRRMGTAAAFAIVSAHSSERLGSVALTFGTDGVAEIGYWVAAGARGRGVAGGAVELLASWAFAELGLERLELKTMAGNRGSERVAEKAGFDREGVLRAAQSGRDGTRVDLTMWSRIMSRTAPPAPGPGPAPEGTSPPAPS